MNYGMDTGAMMAFLDNEPGADIVEDILTEPGSICYAHVYNLAEIYYLYFRKGGAAVAEDTIQSLLDCGIILRDDNDLAFWKEAATHKASLAIPLPDAFCLTLARRIAGTVVTADHGDFDQIVPLGYCPILFIR